MTWIIPNPTQLDDPLLRTFGDLSKYLETPTGKRMKVYASTTARDADNLTPSAGDEAFTSDTTTYWLYDGTAWRAWDLAWQTYTPTLTNLTLGNGTVSGKYMRQGIMCDTKFGFVLGSTSAVGTSPSFSFPMTMADPFGELARNSLDAIVHIVDSGTAIFGGLVRATTTTVTVLYWNAAATALQQAGITATVPHTWAVNDSINVVRLRTQMA